MGRIEIQRKKLIPIYPVHPAILLFLLFYRGGGG